MEINVNIQDLIAKYKEDNIYLSIGWCCKYGDGDTSKGWNLIKNKIKYSNSYHPTLEAVVDILKEEGWE